MVTFVDRARAQVTLTLDARSQLPVRLSSIGGHPVFGDAETALLHSDDHPVAGLATARKIAVDLGPARIFELDVETIAPRPAVDEAALTPPAGQPTPFPVPFTFQEVSPGVHLVPVCSGLGITYNSLVVELDAGLLVAEAPLWEGYSRILPRGLAERFPGKPVLYLVLTRTHDLAATALVGAGPVRSSGVGGQEEARDLGDFALGVGRRAVRQQRDGKSP